MSSRVRSMTGRCVTCGPLQHRLEHRPAGQGRERVESRNPRDRVALVVQTRAPNAQAATARNNREDASGNAAFGRQPDPVSELARRVVSAAGQHDRVDALGVASRHQPRAVEAHAVTGEEASGQGELGAAHRDGAVADVVIKHATDRVFQVAVARQEMSERGVAVTVLGFGGRDYLIASDLWASTLGPQESLDGAARVSGERQQTVGDDQGAGIDEWIARDSVLVLELDKRIERGARRLASNPGPHRLAILLDYQSKREQLRDALDREPPAPLPDPVYF